MTSLAEQLRLARERKGWTQDQLAAEVRKSKQWISLIERGEQVPSPGLLVALYEKCLVADREPDAELAAWLLQWVEDKTTDVELGEHAEALHKAVRKAKTILSSGVTPITPGRPRSLEDFPSAFMPLTVICGDRREFPAHSRGDLLAHSVAVTDVQFLSRLALPPATTTIKSDKSVLLMAKDDLRREFGQSNLLILGSPAVNLAARLVNDGSVFRFLVSRERRAQNRILREDKRLNDRPVTSRFSELLAERQARSRQEQQGYTDTRFSLKDLSDHGQTPPNDDRAESATHLMDQVLGDATPEEWMDGFRKPGLLDPTNAAVHGRSTRQDHDFAIVSLAENPFADDGEYVSILVAGIHGPGTAHAVRALADGNFRGRPLGAVIEVFIDHYGKDWPRRFQTAEWEWRTDPYEVDAIISCLKSAVRDESSEPEWPFSELTSDEINGCVEFVRRTSGL